LPALPLSYPKAAEIRVSHASDAAGNRNWHAICFNIHAGMGSALTIHFNRQNGTALRTLREGTKKMSLEDSLFGIHGKALQLRSQRLELIASNIANASTPGYKARDIDFDAALAQATKKQGTVNSALEEAMGYRVPLQTSSDGNTVEMSTEQTLFAENAVKYRTTLSFLEGRLNTITRALRGE
jgi:flagellar basal-body rod protein FlgB